MKTNTKHEVGSVLVTILLTGMLLLSGVACADVSNERIFEPVNFNKESVRYVDILNDFETVTSNPKLFLDDVSDGKVKLEVLGNKLDLELQETFILDENARVFVEDETGVYTIPAAKMKTYSGKVVGDENSSIGFTVSDIAVIGHITTKGNHYAIELTNQTISDKVVLVVYSLDALKEPPTSEISICGVEEHSYVDVSPIPNESETMGILSITNVYILPAYDRDFKNIEGGDTQAQQEILNRINAAEIAYSPAEVDFHITSYKRYGYLLDGTAHEVKNYFVSDIPPYRDITNSDLSILFYGKDFEGLVIGTSDVFNESSNAAYSVVQMVPSGNYGATDNGKSVIVSHELGHNFAAEHGQALSWSEGGTSVYSVMYSPWQGDSKMKLEFTNYPGGHGDLNHDNIDIIRYRKATIAAFQ